MENNSEEIASGSSACESKEDSAIESAAEESESLPRRASVLPSLVCIVCDKNCATRQPTRTPCGHVFCRDCIEEVVMALRSCPTCAALCFGHELKPHTA